MGRPTLDTLFETAPATWGLRGDPGLWRELETQFAQTPLPQSFADLWHTLEEAYEKAVGQPLTNPETTVVKRFDAGGMSGGSIHPGTWATVLFPLISHRYAAIVHSQRT